MTGDMMDLTKFVEEVKKRPPGRIEPLPEVKQVETFIYIPGDRRNPFQKEEEPMAEQVDEPSDNGIAPNPFRRKEELESFPLDTIGMVGTMDQAGTMWGLVMTGGIIYRVKVGNYMGQNHGQIMRITEERIELTEIVPDGKGGYRERRANMALATN
jgi:type IV pilus assembly protein PilP